MHFSRNTWLWLVLSLALMTTSISCSGGGSLNPVTGKVIYQEQPLAGARVILHPQGGTETSTDFPVAITESDGTFSIKTGESNGAPAGTYKATIVCMEKSTEKPKGMEIPEDVDKLKGAYANPETSQFTVEVKEGNNELEPFKVR